jgi:imidazolonepropionase
VRLLTGIGRLYTSTAAGVVADAAVLLDGERIRWVGTRRALDSHAVPGDVQEVGLGGCLVTAGLVDAHTHPVYAGDRLAEVAARSAGASYAEIAATGGGIGRTVTATRAEPAEALAAAVADRLRRWPATGTTTVEAKTGYHLEREGELAAVALLADLDGAPGLPRVDTTFLAAHALPPGDPVEPGGYAEAVASWCEAAAAAGARSCDVFCDEGYFTVDESAIVLRAGAAAGLRARVHADELAHTGGAQLAARLRAASADHLLCIDDADIRALRAGGVSAVLCPATALAMGRVPPARALLDAGVTVSLGSDHNPGTSGLADMTIVIALAVAALGLSVDDALHAATAGGAASLGHADRGVVADGAQADLVAWDADHEGAFAWAWGVRPRRVWLGGTELDVGVR